MIIIKHTASVHPDGLRRLILWSAKANITPLINLSSVLNLWCACLLWFLLFGKCQCEDIAVCSSNGMATHQNLIPFQRNVAFEDQHLVYFFHNPRKQTNSSKTNRNRFMFTIQTVCTTIQTVVLVRNMYCRINGWWKTVTAELEGWSMELQWKCWHFMSVAFQKKCPAFYVSVNEWINEWMNVCCLTAACLCVLDRMPWIFTFSLSIWSIFTHNSLLIGSLGPYVFEV